MDKKNCVILVYSSEAPLVFRGFYDGSKIVAIIPKLVSRMEAGDIIAPIIKLTKDKTHKYYGFIFEVARYEVVE